MSSAAPYSDSWREHYASRRYLESLTLDQLHQRYVDLLDNILAFGDDGTSHLDGLRLDTGWTRRVADLYAEVDLRKIGADWLRHIEQEVLARPYPKVPRAIAAWRGRRFTPERDIIKYGRRDYLADLVEHGRLRLTPASNYDDPSLNPAMRDTELEFSYFYPHGTRLAIERQPGSKTYEDLPLAGPIFHTMRCDNYYVFCASAVFEPRAFDEFGSDYDACVIVHGWEALIDLIKVKPVPARDIYAGSTVYLDPHMLHRPIPSVELAKHCRFEYQKEWRIYLTNPLPPPPLTPFDLELGDLSSFCELVTL
jgi:hypothetical protein